MTRILITGGAGFVGSTLALAFHERFPKYEIVIMDNLRRRGGEWNLQKFQERGISFFHGDIRISSDLEDLPGNFDLFVEASAEPSVHAGMNGSPAYVIDTNLNGMLHALEFSRLRAPNLIFLSTSRVYSLEPLQKLAFIETPTRFSINMQAKENSIRGLSDCGIAEEFPTHLPRSIYGASKLAAEMIAQEYCAHFGVKAILNRCGVIAGPGQFGKVDQGVFTLWLANHFYEKPLSYFGYGGSGKQVRDLLHPLDLFELICKQWEKLDTFSGEVYNVGGGEKISTSLLEWTNLAQNITGKKIPIQKRIDNSAVDIPYYISDTRKVAHDFSWHPKLDTKYIAQSISDWLKREEKICSVIFG